MSGQHATATESTWTGARIRDVVQQKTGKRPCWFQIEVAKALYLRQKDVIGISATGTGKTLSFWIPLMMALEDGKDKMTIVITPLNILGQQNVADLEAAGISAIAISADKATPEVFRDVERGVYRVVVVNPEIVMQNRGEFEKMWNKPAFVSRLLNFTVDEGHVVKQWGPFRPEYSYLGQLRSMIPSTVPFYVASATLPTPTLQYVREHLRLRTNDTEIIRRTNDRPNIQIVVRDLKHAAKTFKDLAFLIPSGLTADSPPPPKFLVFFDNMKESENAIAYLRSRLPRELRSKITYFHSTMSPEFRNARYEALRAGEIWGLCVTDAFGMGLDLPDIYYVVQWKVTCDLSSLWQRFGRGGRREGTQAIAILLVEKKYFDAERERKDAGVNGTNSAAAKRKRDADLTEEPPGKRRKTNGTTEVIAESSKRKRNAPEKADSKAKRSRAAGPSENPSTMTKSIPPQTNSNTESSSSNTEHEGRGPETEVQMDVETRRRIYHSKEIDGAKESKQAGKTKRDVVIGSAIDDFINTSARPGLTCRREVLDVYFNNDKCDNDDFKLCDTSSPSGCSRCKPKAILVCCDLCRPDVSVNNVMDDITNVRPTRTGASRIKPFQHDDRHRDLRTALCSWREQAATQKHGKMIIRQFGSQILMSDQILDRLIMCAQAHKITTVECIVRETQWKPEAYGAAIISILHSHFPLQITPIPSLNTLSSNDTSDANSQSTGAIKPTESHKVPKKRTCSACGGQGHIRTSRMCPARASPQVPTSTPLQLSPPGISSESTRLSLASSPSHAPQMQLSAARFVPAPSTTTTPPTSTVHHPFMYYGTLPVVPPYPQAAGGPSNISHTVPSNVSHTVPSNVSHAGPSNVSHAGPSNVSHIAGPYQLPLHFHQYYHFIPDPNPRNSAS